MGAKAMTPPSSWPDRLLPLALDASAVINLNGDYDDLTHYNHTLALPGDIGANLDRLLETLGAPAALSPGKQAWLTACAEKKAEWSRLKRSRIAATAPIDETWQRRVMTQPQAVKTAADFAKEIGAVKLFDAGDVQANGFQIVEDDRPFETFTESGAYALASPLLGPPMFREPEHAWPPRR